ncbi:YbaK/EbsC family protein [Celerinatantimonas sp. YJH-8]|uniref:YbaK/EbsC family protein n=1 Tax=Celerinatantimonas sp. YJH-8 TaxID=3228714 RepID=UPI0038CA3921
MTSSERVQSFLAQHAPDLAVSELSQSTATVAEAANAFGVTPGQIAKTLSLKVGEAVILLVMAGDSRLHNSKFKQRFGVKPRMLKAEEVEPLTGFVPGGVCPFAAKSGVQVFCDQSLQAHFEILPAGGSRNSGVRITPQRLADICQAQWVDVGQIPELA